GEVKNYGTKVTVEWGFTVYTVPECKGKVIFTVGSKGIHVDYSFDAAAGLPEIPELSLVFPLSKEYERLEYLGKGPDENYIDRNEGSYIGLYKAAVKDIFVPYQKPQEHGERTCVRRASVKKADGSAALTFVSDSEMEINLCPYTAEELENASHIHTLPESDTVYFRAVARQMGIGGYDSWGAHTLEEYKNLCGKEYKYGFSILF
ncbi:MAG: beta-galactosidase, partial [Clostridia bacterium]|nr:beta-galactosidase [Clostridia bacterium]